MIAQPDLFCSNMPSSQRMGWPPASAAADPSTSHEAEKRITNSGARQTQAERVLDAVRRFPLHTSAELAGKVNLNRWQVARRLPDLQHQGKVRQAGKRICGATGAMSVMWDVT